jgi:hypothetical protein
MKSWEWSPCSRKVASEGSLEALCAAFSAMNTSGSPLTNLDAKVF